LESIAHSVMERKWVENKTDGSFEPSASISTIANVRP